MNEILKTVLSLSASASLIAILLLALKPLYKKRFHKTWQYYIWLVVVARLLLPFAPQTNLVGSLFQQAGAVSPPQAVNELLLPDEGQAAEDDGAPSVAATGPDTITEYQAPSSSPRSPAPVSGEPSLWSEFVSSLWLVWMGVAALLLVRKVTSYHSFVRFIKAGREEVDDPDVLDLYFETCEEMGLTPLSIYTNKLAVSPMLVGIVHPVVILPHTDIGDGDLRLVLRHELTHYRRRDILYKWLVQIAVCLHWFNPLVYLVSREINKNCELSCDEAVLRRIDPDHKRDYGDTLLATVQTGGVYGDTVASVTLSEDGRLLKERLEAILSHAAKSRIVAVCSIGLALVLLCSAAYAGAYAGMRTVGDGSSLMEAEVEYATSVVEDVEHAALYEAVSDEIAVEMETAGPATDAPRGLGWIDGMEDWIGDTVENWVDSWVDSWTDEALWDSWADSWSDYGQDGYNLFSNQYYVDNYLFGVRWRRDDNADRYATTVNIKVGTQTYTLAFPEEFQSYASDTAFVRAVQDALYNKIVAEGSQTKWQESVFVITAASGPHTETPEQLLSAAFAADNMSTFLALLGSVKDGDVIMDLLEQAYERDRADYVLFLVGVLPDGYYTDELAERARADGRSSMLLWLSSRTRSAASESSASTPAISRVSKSENAGSPKAMEQAERAVKDKNLVNLSLAIDDLTQSQYKKLAQDAYDASWLYGFTLLMDEIDDEAFLSELAQRAFDEYNYAFQAILMDYLR